MIEKRQSAKERAILVGVSCTAVPDFDNSDDEAMRELQEGGMKVSLAFRQRMAACTFERTSRYDAMIAGYLAKNQA